MLKKMKILVALGLLALSSLVVAGDVSPENVAGATTVDTAKARELFDNEVLFVDVRKNSDWDAGRIPGAVHLELKKVFTAESLGAEAKKDEAIVLYCNGESCLRSSAASVKAVEWGFTKIYYYRDGFPAWKAASNPVE